MIDSLDAVYYSQPVPSSNETLTLLAFIFDKIYFPGVYIPESGVDEQETAKEIERIIGLGIRKIDDVQLVNCMIYALHHKYLKDFCVFTGKFGYMGIIEDGAGEVTKTLDELIFGPPPPNFTPVHPIGFAKGLPGSGKSAVNGPSWITYPANALIYAAKNGLPLVNDDPTLPVPALGGVAARGNAKILSTILAIESIKMALPNLKGLPPNELMEFREQTRDYVKPFRLAMLKMSKELNAAISSEMTMAEVQNHARFLAETTVYPELEELKRIILEPTKPWYKRAVDLAGSAPELLTNFLSMPKHLAIAQLLAKVATTLADLRDEQLDKERKMGRGELHYLLKIHEKMSREDQ